MLLTLVSLMVSGADASLPLQTWTLSENGSSRGTAYCAANKIVTVDGKTHIAWLDSVSVTKVCTYDHATGETGAPVELGIGHDNHGGPSMCADSQGYLHIVFGPHHHPFQYRRSLRPNDTSEWTPVETFAEKATYPSLVCDSNDTLHVVYRQSGERWQLMYQRKPKDGPWSEAVSLLIAPGPGYMQWGNALHVDGNGRLHLGFHIYAAKPQDRGFAFGYFYSDDGGGTWHTTDGEPVALPATVAMCKPIRTSDEMNIRVGTVVAADDGTVYMTVFGRRSMDSRGAGLWKLIDGEWSVTDLEQFMEPPWNLVLSASVGLGSDGTVYAVVTCGEKGWGAPGQEIRLLVSRDGGKTFVDQAVSEPNPDRPRWLPNIERDMGHAPVDVPCFLYTSGEKGKDNKAKTANGIVFVRAEDGAIRRSR
ncbi:MAG: hypothetical protein GY851_13775, partial [bacterium]|nr:hypothetical protein [bacterium]